MTAAMKVQSACIQCFLGLLLVMGLTDPAAAQALHCEQLPNGTELVVVTQPLADATSFAWPDPGSGSRRTHTSGQLTVTADLERLFSAGDGAPPPVLVAVGGATAGEVRAVCGRLFVDRLPSAVSERQPAARVEGRFERRLGEPGSDGQLRLEVHLPDAADPSRGEAEVLWSLLPVLIGGELEGVRSRTEGPLGLLEARTEAALAELAVRRLRIALAQVAESPQLRAADVEGAARRLSVRRLAALEMHPQSSLALLELWLAGAEAAVAEHLFGLDGVTETTVRETARDWLPRHPGNIVVTLPPRTFNPRFASPPTVFRLDSGLSAAVLERTGTPLATLCLRPVVVPDLDDEMAATVLARLSRELRDSPDPPAWLSVGQGPPRLELADAPGSFAELAESLRTTLQQVADDDEAVLPAGGDARRRALRLMAGLLGVAQGAALSPALLLESSNLALGVVAEDDETAVDAIRKFWAFAEGARRGATVQSVAPVPRTREAAAGAESVMVVAIELPLTAGETTEAVIAGLLGDRGLRLLDKASLEVRQPFVPGRRVILVVVSAENELMAVEDLLDRQWRKLVAAPTEDELKVVRQLQAATAASLWSGATGRARRMAAVAAGTVRWRTSTELEMALLSVSREDVSAILAAIGDWRKLANTGAGILPISDAAAAPPDGR